MKQIHFISGIVITVFISLHLYNHFYSLVGIEKHIDVMDTLRMFYRNLFFEILLLFSILIQIVSGVKLFLIKINSAKNFFEKLQLWSGLYIAFFLVIHLSAVFVGRLFLKLDTNIFFGVAGLNTFPFFLFFIPYYGLAIISFFGHLASIHSMKMNKNMLGTSPTKQGYIILFLGVLFSIVILYGLTDGFKGIEIPKEYNVLIGK
ncbi:hypothetical protein [uncultured Tenacibaculum sp.]|uniref:hypothetical protein n=1 Tax=uncultured Tenacibaculum sp. TaxID=174713 RepID=UPI002626C7DA|nr:hypothetical protein [uncultured Tenacibaculum sp.]